MSRLQKGNNFCLTVSIISNLYDYMSIPLQLCKDLNVLRDQINSIQMKCSVFNTNPIIDEKTVQ